MMREVRAHDGRVWTIRSRISWTRPAMADQFEYDMAGGYVSGVAMLGVLVVLILFVMFWTPTDVVMPAWFGLLLLLALLLVPMLWALQRPWVISASTTDGEAEYWEGIVRGTVPAREEARRIADDLIQKGVPDEPIGPLNRMALPESFGAGRAD